MDSGMARCKDPLVSVLMITYNHEKYIRQALDSVLAQRVTFPYEIIVGEDCSSDLTRQIVLEYQARFPEKIHALLPARNLGMHTNCIASLRECRGRFVAWVEGDDYWNSPEKLQAQVDYLQSYPECAICCSRARVIYEDGSREPWDYPIWDRTVFQLPDLLKENFIPTCTAVFRQGLVLEWPAWIRELSFCDWALHVLAAQHGTIAVLPATLATYRVHAAGAWSGMSPEEVLRARQVFYDRLGAYLPTQYAPVIDSLRLDIASQLSKIGS
jgi:glycosyltransferase involved in cell wall biosynthesis